MKHFCIIITERLIIKCDYMLLIKTWKEFDTRTVKVQQQL